MGGGDTAGVRGDHPHSPHAGEIARGSHGDLQLQQGEGLGEREGRERRREEKREEGWGKGRGEEVMEEGERRKESVHSTQ